MVSNFIIDKSIEYIFKAIGGKKTNLRAFRDVDKILVSEPNSNQIVAYIDIGRGFVKFAHDNNMWFIETRDMISYEQAYYNNQMIYGGSCFYIYNDGTVYKDSATI
jgi:hypothetical protein